MVGLGIKHPTAYKMMRLSVELTEADTQRAAVLRDEEGHGKRKASDDLLHDAQRRRVSDHNDGKLSTSTPPKTGNTFVFESQER